MRPQPHPVGGTDWGPPVPGWRLSPACPGCTLASSIYLGTIFTSQCPWGSLEGTKKIIPTIFSTQSPCHSTCSIHICHDYNYYSPLCFTEASVLVVPYVNTVLPNLNLSLCLKRSFLPGLALFCQTFLKCHYLQEAFKDCSLLSCTSGMCAPFLAYSLSCCRFLLGSMPVFLPSGKVLGLSLPSVYSGLITLIG